MIIQTYNPSAAPRIDTGSTEIRKDVFMHSSASGSHKCLDVVDSKRLVLVAFAVVLAVLVRR